jgi:hypothetical protein
VVLFLIQDVFGNRVDLGARIRERSESFLPVEFATDELLFVDEFTRSGFQVANKIGKRDVRGHPEKDMYVVFNTADRYQFDPLVIKNARDVFEEFFFPSSLDEAFSFSNREYDVNENLRVGIRHGCRSYGALIFVLNWFLQTFRPYGAVAIAIL